MIFLTRRHLQKKPNDQSREISCFFDVNKNQAPFTRYAVRTRHHFSQDAKLRFVWLPENSIRYAMCTPQEELYERRV